MMDHPKVERLNSLFEKMLSNNANSVEQHELTALYQEYINDGRDTNSGSYQRKNTRAEVKAK
ncbi:hypothetical protein [Thalassotalea piscium]|uniref:Uncharacterized protein YnzC (UPF0291/DUF896 family) n=1 Tax=Thalassotalea piscium TaxID=1230533 RepID=A0A7X0NJR1_9GAMM|nr:hypothetical protein [Thalassotalea piscium]MBB6544685.1 uncharacterized protein YnzC (UPF0291/DUF896 family) [Thalassotalea piscium]